MAKDVASGVKAMEMEAEKILEDARASASENRLKAKEETKRILSAELPMDEVKAECEQIVSKAKKQADKEVKYSEKEASEISSNASKRADKYVELIASIVTGEKQK